MLLGDKAKHVLRFINMLYNFGTSTGYILLIIRTLANILNIPDNIYIKVKKYLFYIKIYYLILFSVK